MYCFSSKSPYATRLSDITAKVSRLNSPSVASTLTLLLAACGGGGGGGTPSTGSSSGSTSSGGTSSGGTASGGASSGTAVSGNAVKGPLQGATVFIDLNSNGILDTGELSTTTGDGGAFSFSSVPDGDYEIVVLTRGAIDESTGQALAEPIVLRAPKDATVVTPLTTVMVETGMSATALADVLGLGGTDILTFNPFDAANANSENAVKAEQAAVMIVNLVNEVAAGQSAATGGSASAASILESTFKAVASSIKADSDAGNTIAIADFADAGRLTTIVASAKANLQTEVGDSLTFDDAAFAASFDVTTKAASLAAKATTLAELTSLSGDAAQAILQEAGGSYLIIGTIETEEEGTLALALSRGISLKLDDTGKEYIVFVTSAAYEGQTSLNNITPVPLRIYGLDDEGRFKDLTDEVLSANPGQVIARDLIVDDFNNDGYDDLFVNNHGTERYEIFEGESNQLYLSDGKGGLIESSSKLPDVEADFGHMSSSGDLDGDGIADLYVNNLSTNDSYIAFNDGTGGFGTPHFLDLDAHLGQLGRVDNTQSERFLFEKLSGYSSAASSAIIDVDHDGDNDIVSLGHIEWETRDEYDFIMLNDGDGNFTLDIIPDVFNGVGVGTESIGVADFDGDGYNEIMAFGVDGGELSGTGNIIVKYLVGSETGLVDKSSQLGDNNGTFGLTQGVAKGFSIVDIDADGDLDVYYKNYTPDYSGESDLLLVNDGAGNFTEGALDTAKEWKGVTFAFGDLDGDGSADVVYANNQPDNEAIHNTVSYQSAMEIV